LVSHLFTGFLEEDTPQEKGHMTCGTVASVDGLSIVRLPSIHVTLWKQSAGRLECLGHVPTLEVRGPLGVTRGAHPDQYIAATDGVRPT
jgi:hypothetical protein